MGLHASLPGLTETRLRDGHQVIGLGERLGSCHEGLKILVLSVGNAELGLDEIQ